MLDWSVLGSDDEYGGVGGQQGTRGNAAEWWCGTYSLKPLSLLFFIVPQGLSFCTTYTPFRRVTPHFTFSTVWWIPIRGFRARSTRQTSPFQLILGPRIRLSLDIPSFASQCCPSATSAFTRIPSKHVFGFDLWALCVCNPYSVLQRFRQGAQDKGHPSCVFRLGKRRRRVQDQMEGRYQPLDRLPRRFRRYVVIYTPCSCTSILINFSSGCL